MNANTAAKAENRANAIALIAAALPGFETLFREAVAAVRQKVLVDGRISSARLEAEQHAAHGLSWLRPMSRPFASSRPMASASRRKAATAPSRIMRCASVPANTQPRFSAAFR